MFEFCSCLEMEKELPNEGTMISKLGSIGLIFCLLISVANLRNIAELLGFLTFIDFVKGKIAYNHENFALYSAKSVLYLCKS